MHTLWKISQPDYLGAGHHVQRQRVVYHRLLGQDEAADRRVVGFRQAREERIERDGGKHDAGIPDNPSTRCRHHAHVGRSLFIRQWNKHVLTSEQHALVRELVEFDLTNCATAWSWSFSWRAVSQQTWQQAWLAPSVPSL